MSQPPMDSLAAVRKRPGMYAGDTRDGSGLHLIAFSLIDAAFDEVRNGHATGIDVTLDADGACTVEDDGRGMSVELSWPYGRPAAEVAFTELHAGTIPSADGLAWRASHGVDPVVAAALSSWLELRIWRDGGEYFLVFLEGSLLAPLTLVCDAPLTAGRHRSGTCVSFRPSPRIFTPADFEFETIEARLRALAQRGRGRFSLTDARTEPPRRSMLGDY